MNAQVNPYKAPATDSPDQRSDARQRYVPLGGRTTRAVALVLGTTLTRLSWHVAQLAFGMPSTSQSPEDVGVLVVGLIGLVFSLLSLVSAVVVLAWMHRASANLRGLERYGLRFSPAACVASVFIPIVNLVRPVQVMSEIWRASDPNEGEARWRASPGTPLAGIWWGAWSAAALAEPIAEGAKSPELLLVSFAFFAIAGGCLVKMMRDITARQEQAMARLEADAKSELRASAA